MIYKILWTCATYARICTIVSIPFNVLLKSLLYFCISFLAAKLFFVVIFIPALLAVLPNINKRYYKDLILQ